MVEKKGNLIRWANRIYFKINFLEKTVLSD